MTSRREKPFHSSITDLKRFEESTEEAHIEQPGYTLAFADRDFLLREELRPVRLQLELLKPEITLQDEGVESTLVFFGSARTPTIEMAQALLDEAKQNCEKDPDNPQYQKQLARANKKMEHSTYYEEARKLANIVGEFSVRNGVDQQKLYVTTGGGPGIMEAANRGAQEAQARSLALGIIIPHEQIPNQYVTPELIFPFHYFAIRKMHFLIRAVALVAFPGGFGTFDEIFDALTLLQTKKMEPIPLLLFNRQYWESVINFDALVEEGVINEEDLDLIKYVDTAEEAWEHIQQHADLS